VLAWGLLEWTFVVILIGLTCAVGVLFVYLLTRLFVNPGRAPRRL
jgi:hypothetical protein